MAMEKNGIAKGKISPPLEVDVQCSPMEQDIMFDLNMNCESPSNN